MNKRDLTEEEIIERIDNPDIDKKEINELFNILIELKWNDNVYMYGNGGVLNV